MQTRWSDAATLDVTAGPPTAKFRLLWDDESLYLAVEPTHSHLCRLAAGTVGARLLEAMLARRWLYRRRERRRELRLSDDGRRDLYTYLGVETT